MSLRFQPIKDRPAHWSPPDVYRPRSAFSAGYGATIALLDRELDALGAVDAVVQVDAVDGDLRLDGQLRAGAKVGHPGVILTVVTRSHGTLVYDCDRFGSAAYKAQPGWQANLRAIALGLEALRKVDRYGMGRGGQQYAGFAAFGAGADRPAVEAVEAAEFICGLIGGDSWVAAAMLTDPGLAADGYRQAAKVLHPDVGGDPERFRRLQQARDRLVAGR